MLDELGLYILGNEKWVYEVEVRSIVVTPGELIQLGVEHEGVWALWHSCDRKAVVE